jgi:DNA mismatch endonuclease (patch repair protein)
VNDETVIDKTIDTAVDPNVSRRMSNTRGRDSAPELAVRRILHAAGLRYRVNARPVSNVRRTADIVFPRQRIVVLIDGCFWHGCPDHYRPATGARAAFWAKKIEQNRRRDVESTTFFETADWTVLRFWEHEDPEDVARSIHATVAGATRPRT